MKESERRLIERLIGTLERVKLDEYVEYVSNRKRLVLTNLFYGMLRGLGFSLGFTVLRAAALTCCPGCCAFRSRCTIRAYPSASFRAARCCRC